jgi:hypothetical protein
VWATTKVPLKYLLRLRPVDRIQFTRQMNRFGKGALACVLVAGGGMSLVSASFAAPQAAGKPAVTIRRVAVRGSSNDMEVEITASEPVTPQTHVVTGPDRLVIDFPNAVPGSDLHNIVVNSGEVKEVRVGLFSTNPPVTRVVLDLKTPRPYQLLPSGNTVILRLSTRRKQATALPSRPAVVSRRSAPPAPPAKPGAKVEVAFQNGKLSIWADKATLAEVLYEVQRRTGADIPIPSGAEQEQVVANIGPAPAREVLATLLNGSRFNFIMVGSERDPAQLKSVILTMRGEGISQPVIYSPVPPVAHAMPEAEPPQPSVQPNMQPEPPEPADAPPPQR